MDATARQHTADFGGDSIRERLRLAALHSYGILDTCPEPEFDRFVRIAALRFAAPISLISLIDDSRQWFKARIGLDVCHTSRDIAFCTHTIAERRSVTVADARVDPRFADNPLVAGAPFVRFYAGAPLITPLGRVLGTINVIDGRLHPTWSARDTADLEEMAREVMTLLEHRRHRIVVDRALAERPTQGTLRGRS